MKRKTMKKAGAAVLTMALLLSMGAMATPVYAETGDALTIQMKKITCDGEDVELAAMNVYQVAKRDNTGRWDWNDPFKNVNTTPDTPELLKTFTAAELNELAKSFKRSAANAASAKVSVGNASLVGDNYQITIASNNGGTNVDGVGYYLVVPAATDNTIIFQPALVEIDSAGSEYTTVKAKANPIPLHKYITATTLGETSRTDGKSKTSTATVNDVISYSIESVLPTYAENPDLSDQVMSYVMTDDPSAGIDIDVDTIEVTIGQTVVYNKTTTAADVAVVKKGDVGYTGDGFELTISGQKLVECMGADIKVTFDAAIDEENVVWGSGTCGEGGIHTDANGVDLTGNPNTVMLTWGNNYVTGGYVNPDNPDGPEDPEHPYVPDEPMKKDSVTTYVGKVEIVKQQQGEEGTLPLAGAVFTLSKAEDASFSKRAVSLDDGLLDFGYLPAGTYTLREVSAPNGFKTFGASYTFTVTTKATSADSVDFDTYEVDPEIVNTSEVIVENVTFTRVEDTNSASARIEILDPPADILPATGGIGTYVFTFGGAAIILLAAVLFVVYMKKRKAED